MEVLASGSEEKCRAKSYTDRSRHGMWDIAQQSLWWLSEIHVEFESQVTSVKARLAVPVMFRAQRLRSD